MAVLELRSVTLSVDKTPVVRDVSMALREQESVAFIGPSGEGKTLLLKSIAGLHPIDGEIERNIEGSPIGMSFQRGGLFDSWTVLENLLFPLREVLKVKGTLAEDRARAMLDEVGLSGTEKLYPHEMSGGMQKRLGIARALILAPKLALYDDPTAGLDPITSREIVELILDMKTKYGMALILSTSELPLAFRCDRIAFIYGGGVLRDLTPSELKSDTHPVIRQFLEGSLEGPLT